MNWAKKIGVIVLAAGIFCGVTGYANAKGPKGQGGGQYMEHLTPEQQNQARAIFEEAKTGSKGLREEIAAKRAELEAAMKNGETARIESIAKELGELRGKELVNRMETAAKLKQAGLPELKKPGRGDEKPGKSGSREEFANRRIAELPEAKQGEARKLFAEFLAGTAQYREALKANRAAMDKALETGDASAVAGLAATQGELQGKLMLAKLELRQKLVKADIPADTFDRDGKKGGKGGKDGRGRKGGHDGRGKDGKSGKGMD